MIIDHEFTQTSRLQKKPAVISYLFTFFTDIDECAEDPHACDVYAYCVNTPGSYNCPCKSGYNYNGSMCSGMMLHLKGSSLLL